MEIGNFCIAKGACNVVMGYFRIEIGDFCVEIGNCSVEIDLFHQKSSINRMELAALAIV